jgi:amino acid transporter
MSLTVTLAILIPAGLLFALSFWRSALPADPLRPRLMPWRAIMIFSGAVALLMLVHLVNLFGIETGGRTGMR